MNRYLFTSCLIILAAALAATVSRAAAVGESLIVERGLDHRVHERVSEVQVAPGTVVQRKSRVVELGTGMHRIVDGQYVACRNTIELLDGHAVARQTRLPIIFAASPNAQAAIDSEAPDGQRFRCNILGLALFDASNGNSLLINEVQDSAGELHPPNRVYYPGALGGTSPEFPVCDLYYTVELAGWEQFVLLRNKFSLPAAFDPETTRLECWTEFLAPPTPTKHVRAVNGMADENLNFGAVTIGPGKAFMLDAEGANGWSTPVAKTWIQIGGRFFLIEAVPWKAIQPRLEQLPPAGQQAAVRRNAAFAKISKERIIPAPRPARKPAQPMRMASVPMPNTGVVFDFSHLLSGNSVTLEGDKTYLVSSAVVVTNLTIEGGCVVKYTNTSKIELALGGTLLCQTGPYRPAIFTSVFDSTVGETISTTGTPQTFNCDTALALHDSIYTLQHLRFSYAQKGISLDDGTVTLKHSTFSHVARPFYVTADVNFYNGLIYDANYALDGGGGGTRFEHVTCNDIDYFAGSGSPTLTYYLTNCILTDLSYWGTGVFYTNAVVTNISSSVYQSVGGSKHYLSANSPYRNAGVSGTVIGPELRSKTTYPPIAYPYASFITNRDLVLSPQAQRDTDTPDLGWHSEVLDFVFGVALITNATVSIRPGTVVGFYNTQANGYGLACGPGGRIIAEGSPTNLARLVRYSTVQEISTTNWAGSIGPLIQTPWEETAPPAPEFRFGFTDFSVLANETHLVLGNYIFVTNMGPLTFSDCQLRGGMVHTILPSLIFTNCLFERVDTQVSTYEAWPFTNRFQNNLFYGGQVMAAPFASTNEITFRDNLFDRTIISGSDVANSHNGYFVNSNRLSPSGSTDVILTNITYQAGPLSRFYLPTNSPLVNTGSVNNASHKGFYWHTSFTNQTLEGTTPLNIGKLWIAFQTNNPTLIIDDDFDGDPNHDEDINGDGDLDSGETDWTNPNDWGFRIFITKPAAGSLIP